MPKCDACGIDYGMNTFEFCLACGVRLNIQTDETIAMEVPTKSSSKKKGSAVPSERKWSVECDAILDIVKDLSDTHKGLTDEEISRTLGTSIGRTRYLLKLVLAEDLIHQDDNVRYKITDRGLQYLYEK